MVPAGHQNDPLGWPNIQELASIFAVQRAYLAAGACSLAMMFGFGAAGLIPVFIDPLEAEFGWSRGEISFSYTLFSVGAAVGGVAWGSLADRFSTRVIALIGAVVLSLGLLMLRYQSTLAGFYAVSFAMGAAGLGCFYAPLAAVVGLWFDRGRGLAMGVVTAGGAFGQGFVPLVGRHLIDAVGWQGAYGLLGIAYALLLVPAMMLVAKPPIRSSHRGAQPSSPGRWRLAPRTSVGMLTVASFFCCATMAVPLVHLVPMLIGRGENPTDAAAVLMLVMASATVGRVTFGLIADRFGPLATYMAASAIQSVMACGLVWIADPVARSIVAVVFGFGFSGVMTCLILCVRAAVSDSTVGRNVALVGLVAWFGMGFGGYAGGVIFDIVGFYGPAFVFALISGAINLAILATLASKLSAARAGRLAGADRVVAGVPTAIEGAGHLKTIIAVAGRARP